MPSLESRVFNRLAGNRLKRTFGDFELELARREFSRTDKLFVTRPKGVDIEKNSLTHCEANWVRPRTRTDRYIVYYPGGAWVLRTPKLHLQIAAKLAKAANANVLIVFYRLAPEHLFPSGLEDCMEGYCCLLESGISASQIVIGGDSAGGNLALASLLKIRDQALPQPAAAFALSPCTDMGFGPGGSPMPADGEGNDQMLILPGSRSDNDPRRLYVGGDNALLEHPYASPARADLKGLCPILIHVSSNEAIRDQCEFFVKRAKRAGVQVELEIWDRLPHVWHGMPFPESAAAFGHLSDYIRHRIVSDLDAGESRGARILQRLHEDHGRFGRVLTMIGRDAWRLIDDPQEVLPVFSEAIEYIANYQNVHHHPCEEEMFALLASKSPESRDAAKKLTREHDIAQRTGLKLLALLSGLATDDQSRESYENLAHGLKDFADYMRAHIKEEEQLLYSAAWKMCTDDDWETISFQEPGEDPLSDNGQSEYPLLSDYVSGNREQSRVIFLNENMIRRLRRVFNHIKSGADCVISSLNWPAVSAKKPAC